MKHAKHFLLMVATLLCSIAVHAQGITAVSQLSNTTLYFVSQPGHLSGTPTSWVIISESDALQVNSQCGVTSSADDANQQFAFISNDGGNTHYLYHPARKMFVNKDASLSALPMNAVHFTAGNQAGTFVVYFDASSVINTNDNQGLVINRWGPLSGYGEADAGNSCAIIPVGEFDPTEALATFAAADEEKRKIVEFKAGANGWIYGTESYDDTLRIVEFTSPLYQFSDKVETLRFTVNRTKGNTKYFCLSELEFCDADGRKIELTASDITSNADHNALNPTPDGGGIPALLDGETSTYFHSAWLNMPAEDHYLEITLPNGGYDAFSFRMLSRARTFENGKYYDQSHTFPGVMVMTTSAPLEGQAPVIPDTPEVSGVVSSLSDADPAKCYSISTNGRGAWAVDAEGTIFSATGAMGFDVDATDARQQFAILSANEEDYYLYSVSAKKFVKSDGSLVPFVGDAIEFADASSMGEGRVQVRFKDIAKGYINLNNYGQMVIDGWSTIDTGNAVLIAEADDFDATEALAILANPEQAELNALIAQAQELLAANADNHATEPALGQYATGAYKNLVATVNSDTVGVADLEYFIAAFEASKCLPVFTIDGTYDYADGMSVYDGGGQYPNWKATDRTDESMLWVFDMTDAVVGVTDKVVVKNYATGNPLMGADFIRVAETSEDVADDGLFLMFREEDTEYTIWASQTGMVVPSQGIFSANSTSAWKFTYAGTTYGIEDVPDVPDTPDTPDTPVVPDTTVTESYNWAGIYTVSADELEVLNADVMPFADQMFAMEVVYYQETNQYIVTGFAGFGLEEINPYGGILLTPSADDPNKAEIECDILSNDPELLLNDMEFQFTPLTITRLEDGTFTISDFCIEHWFEIEEADGSVGSIGEPAAWYRGLTAVEYTKYTTMPINYYSGLNGWIQGTSICDSDKKIAGYTSPLYRFEDKVETFRITVKSNMEGSKFFCFSELELYDENGAKIELTEANVVTNADHNVLNPGDTDGGGISALFDGDTDTYFHSAWKNIPSDDHYLEVTLPDGGYDAFSFRLLSRAADNEGRLHNETFPAVMVIDVPGVPETPDTPDTPVLSGVVSSLSDVDLTKCYTISTNGRGTWAVDAEGTTFSTTGVEGYEVNAEDARQQFAIVSANDEDYYLYSVSAKKFVKRDRSLVVGVADAIEFVDASSQGEGRVMVRFRDITNSNINIGGDNQMVINGWGTIDAGNAVLIAEADDFDAAEALAILANPEEAERNALIAQALELVEANADNHAVEPAIGQYATEAYETLAAMANSDTVSVAYLKHVVAAFEASKCLPVFTINGIADFVAGKSIYEFNGRLYWTATDRTDESMLWMFDMTDTIVGVTDKVVVKNLATGRLFDNALFVQVSEPQDGTEGYWICPEGLGVPMFAYQDGRVERAYSWSSDSPHTWEFVYAGTTYGINELPSEPEQPSEPDTPDTPDPGEFYMAPLAVKGKASSVVNIPIVMENSAEVVGFQFDLYLPEGVTAVSTMEDDETLYDITFNKERVKSSHVIDAELQEDGALRIFAFSTANTAFVGNSGIVLEVAVNVGDLEDGEYPIIVRNVCMSDEYGAETTCPPFRANLIVENTLMGDVNGDGKYTMSDAVMVINAVLNREQANFDANAADMNGDGQIMVGDAISVLRLVLGGGEAKAPARSAARREAAALSATINSVTVGDVKMEKGQVAVVSVELNNETQFTAFSMKLRLPEGFNVATVINEDGDEELDITLNAERKKSSHLLQVVELGDGVVSIGALSTKNAAFYGTSGELLQIGIEATDAAVAGDYTAQMYDVVFTTSEPQDFYLDDVQFGLNYSVVPNHSITVSAGQYGRCIWEGHVIEPEGSYAMSFEQGTAIQLFFVPFKGYAASAMTRNGEVVYIQDNVYEESAAEDVVFADVKYVKVTDTIFVTEVEELPVPEITFEDGIVTITCEDVDATILYAINGNPMEGSVYTAPFEMTEDAVISAIAVKSSEVAVFSVEGTGIAHAQARIVSQRYYDENGVEVESPEKGITIVVAEYEDGTKSVYKMVRK